MSETVPIRALYPARATGEPPKRRRVEVPQRKVIDKAFALLDDLGVAGPLEAREAYSRAGEIEGELDAFGNGGTAGLDSDALVAQVAAGEVSVAEIANQLAGTAEVRREVRALLKKAATVTLRHAWRALQGHGEKWLDELVPIIEDCIAKPTTKRSAERWEQVYELAGLVIDRAPGAARISHPISEHRYEHPDAVHFWLLANAKSYKLRGRRELPSVDLVEYTPTGEPKLDLPTVAAHAAAWSPTLLTGDQVAANARRIRAEGGRDDFELPRTAEERADERRRAYAGVAA